MVLTKLVVTPQGSNRIELTAEEEQTKTQEWADNIIARDQRDSDLAAKKTKKEAAMEKIYANAGLTAQERLDLK